MDYIKTIWKNGDVITAEKLNNIEDGIDGIRQEISGVPLVITMDEPRSVSGGAFHHTRGGLTVNELVPCIFKGTGTDDNDRPVAGSYYIGSASVRDDSSISLSTAEGVSLTYFPTADNEYGDTGLLRAGTS